KRGDPGREEYVEVPAGGKAEAVVDLAQVYEFNEPGHYRVEVTQGPHDVATDPSDVPRPRDRHQALSLSCPVLEIDVTPQACGAGCAPRLVCFRCPHGAL
ncbi:MAG TPA: hypothetical protein VMW27_18205, partial [Thermoanaerobaculia bacterium]|nr:hypothetical protein [Thermoanaerobaculia bacterium]